MRVYKFEEYYVVEIKQFGIVMKCKTKDIAFQKGFKFFEGVR